MDYLSAIINLIPQLLIYFVPGYIALEIRRNNRQENKYTDRDLVIQSITYSFIIQQIASFLDWVTNCIFKLDFIIVDAERDVITYFIISILFGCAITLFPDTKIAAKLRKLLNSNTEPYSNVWNLAMKAPEGAWARVYLEKENLVYVGELLKYTCDPDETRREVLLRRYALYRVVDNKVDLIDNYNEDETAYVYINVTDVKRIEIFKDKSKS